MRSSPRETYCIKRAPTIRPGRPSARRTAAENTKRASEADMNQAFSLSRFYCNLSWADYSSGRQSRCSPHLGLNSGLLSRFHSLTHDRSLQIQVALIGTFYLLVGMSTSPCLNSRSSRDSEWKREGVGSWGL